MRLQEIRVIALAEVRVLFHVTITAPQEAVAITAVAVLETIRIEAAVRLTEVRLAIVHNLRDLRQDHTNLLLGQRREAITTVGPIVQETTILIAVPLQGPQGAMEAFAVLLAVDLEVRAVLEALVVAQEAQVACAVPVARVDLQVEGRLVVAVAEETTKSKGNFRI